MTNKLLFSGAVFVVSALWFAAGYLAGQLKCDPFCDDVCHERELVAFLSEANSTPTPVKCEASGFDWCMAEWHQDRMEIGRLRSRLDMEIELPGEPACNRASIGLGYYISEIVRLQMLNEELQEEFRRAGELDCGLLCRELP